MPASTSIIRQFSAPTCDLKITAKNSLLSRWAGKSVLENLKFRLSFEKVNSGRESLTIRGNREQIESLYNTVSIYIRDLLRGSPEHLAINFLQEATSEAETPSFESETPSFESETQADEATVFFPNVDSSIENGNPKSTKSLPANSVQMLPVQTRMRSNGLAHELVLGSLETQKTGPSILLDFIELNDLATVLDDYYNQVTVIPNFGTSPLIQRPLIWAGSAAAILVAVGVTATAIRMGNPTKNSKGEVASVEELDPSLTDPSLTDPSLIDIPPLPMPELEGGLPSPNSEDGLDTLASPEGGINLIEPLAPENPTAGSSEANSPIPSSPIPTIPSSPQTNIPTRPNEPIVRQPSQALPSPPQRSLPTLPSQRPSGASVAPSAPRTGATSQANRPPAATPRQTPQVPPNAPTLPEFSPPSRSVEEIYGGIASAPSQTGNTPTTARVSPSPTNQNGAANIPQIAEVKRYFEQRWQPPTNLAEPLEYLLYLNRDGSLQRIIPLGETSKTNLDQTKIPLLNEPFVSSLSAEGTPQIRVVLGTNGKVETFLEGIN